MRQTIEHFHGIISRRHVVTILVLFSAGTILVLGAIGRKVLPGERLIHASHRQQLRPLKVTSATLQIEWLLLDGYTYNAVVLVVVFDCEVALQYFTSNFGIENNSQPWSNAYHPSHLMPHKYWKI